MVLTCDATRRALYSLIQFTTVSLLYSIASTLGDFQVGSRGKRHQQNRADLAQHGQFLYIDLFLILPIAVTSTPARSRPPEREN